MAYALLATDPLTSYADLKVGTVTATGQPGNLTDTAALNTKPLYSTGNSVVNCYDVTGTKYIALQYNQATGVGQLSTDAASTLQLIGSTTKGVRAAAPGFVMDPAVGGYRYTDIPTTVLTQTGTNFGGVGVPANFMAGIFDITFTGAVALGQLINVTAGNTFCTASSDCVLWSLEESLLTNANTMRVSMNQANTIAGALNFIIRAVGSNGFAITDHIRISWQILDPGNPLP